MQAIVDRCSPKGKIGFVLENGSTIARVVHV